jgi:hypothetical protein
MSTVTVPAGGEKPKARPNLIVAMRKGTCTLARGRLPSPQFQGADEKLNKSVRSPMAGRLFGT